MPVGFTSQRSVQVSGFDDIGRLTPLQRLVSASCSSGQRFAFGFLQIRSYPRHPCRSANSSPCRASRGLTPPSECALPGAPKKKGSPHSGPPLRYFGDTIFSVSSTHPPTPSLSLSETGICRALRGSFSPESRALRPARPGSRTGSDGSGSCACRTARS